MKPEEPKQKKPVFPAPGPGHNIPGSPVVWVEQRLSWAHTQGATQLIRCAIHALMEEDGVDSSTAQARVLDSIHEQLANTAEE